MVVAAEVEAEAAAAAAALDWAEADGVAEKEELTPLEVLTELC